MKYEANTYRHNISNRRNISRRRGIKRKNTYNKPVFTLALTFVAAIAFVVCMQLVNVNANKSDSTTMKREYISVDIKSGDSLCSIASEYMGVGYSDVNDYIKDIKQLNGMKSDTIYSGDKIILPRYVAVEE